MSLKQAMADLAERMEADLIERRGDLTATAEILLRSYARELRTAAMVAEEVPSYRHGDQIGPGLVGQDYDYHRRMIESARREFHKDFYGKDLVEGDQTVEAIGGPADDSLVPIPSSMPPGTKTVVGGAIYELRSDRKLHHVKS